MNNRIDVNGISYKNLRIYKYEILKQYKIELYFQAEGFGFSSNYFSYDYGLLTIKPGYKFDGPSGPTIDTDSFMRGSLVHDVLYQAIREGHLTLKHRKAADDILYRICREDGMGRIRAWYTYRCVRMFGKSSAIKGKYDI